MDNVQMFTELSKLIISAMGVTVGCFVCVAVLVGVFSCEPMINTFINHICERYNLNFILSFLIGLVTYLFCICCLIFSNVFMMRYFALSFLELFNM